MLHLYIFEQKQAKIGEVEWRRLCLEWVHLTVTRKTDRLVASNQVDFLH